MADTLTKEQRKDLMQRLADIGGGQFSPEDDIIQQGRQLILPENMGMQDAVEFLEERIDADRRAVDFHRKYKFRPFDGAVCTWRALKNVFGMVGLSGKQSFFGLSAPDMIEVPVSYGEVETVPWGVFTLPAFKNTSIIPDTWYDAEMGTMFALQITAPRKYRAQVEGLFALVQNELETNSIYRGKAFDGQQNPEFLDLSGISPEKVIYSEETMVQLDANIWSVLRYRDELARAGISRKRSALLHGPYGTGKTLGGFLTAQVAVESGWTFIYARPGKDNIEHVIQTARLYQPACVFLEDLDTVADPESSSADSATRLLDIFDGITSKSTELMVVLTTNHPDRIHRGMLRPGRLDAVIEIGALDQRGVTRLIQSVVPEGSLSIGVDWDKVFEAAEGMLPAYVKEIADRAYRYALSRTGQPDGILLETADLVHAANGLRPQFELMTDANEHKVQDNLGQAVARSVRGAVTQAVVQDWDLDAAQRGYIIVKDEAVKEAKKALNGSS